MTQDKHSILERSLNDFPKEKKYYVYRLVDPRTLQTFYVGKGTGKRAFQHVECVQSLISKEEDARSLKENQIMDIVTSGQEVIVIFHRRGLTERTALEVESALIDAYPGLTNIQRGYDFERGLITAENLYASINTQEYTEPAEKYVIIKVTPEVINIRGGLYEATCKEWRASYRNAQSYHYVLAVVNGIVCEVYKVKRWYQYNKERIAFEGEPTTDSMSSLKRMRIPDKYRKKGLANPFLYKK